MALFTDQDKLGDCPFMSFHPDKSNETKEIWMVKITDLGINPLNFD